MKNLLKTVLLLLILSGCLYSINSKEEKNLEKQVNVDSNVKIYGEIVPTANEGVGIKESTQTAIIYVIEGEFVGKIKTMVGLNVVLKGILDKEKGTLMVLEIINDDKTEISSSERFQDNKDGTVLDKLTGLMWQQDEFNNITYEDAEKTSKSFSKAGYEDWRIPCIEELLSIVDIKLNKPPFNSLLGSSNTEYFWSSDASIREKNRIWILNAGGGIGTKLTSESKAAGGSKIYSLKCVRGNREIEGPRFVKNNDTTVTDNLLGVIWQQKIYSGVNIAEAKQIIEKINTNEKLLWRLPTMPELAMLCDRNNSNPAVNTNYFTNIISEKYWTASEAVGTGKTWYVDLSTGMTTYDSPEMRHNIILVKNK